MLTSEELTAIRERCEKVWGWPHIDPTVSVAQASADIPALLDTVEELRRLLRRIWEFRFDSTDRVAAKQLASDVKEALR